jgi:phosphatidylserine decarboxylase
LQRGHVAWPDGAGARSLPLYKARILSFLLLALVLSLVSTLPLAWKWVLGMRRVAATVVAISLCTGLMILAVPAARNADSILIKAGVNWLLTLVTAVAVLAYRFYRDPERSVPLTPGLVVSPADGEVLYVRQSQQGALPISTKNGRSYSLEELTKTPLQTEDATVVGIGMSFLDVHVNRAPIAGRITSRQHFPGFFGSLRLPEMVFRNERLTTIIESPDCQVVVVQIASRLVRQIVSFVQESQEVTRGQRIGVIRLGSQVDLVLPRRADLRVTVSPGDRLTAGQSVVAILEPALAGASRSGHVPPEASYARRH